MTRRLLIPAVGAAALCAAFAARAPVLDAQGGGQQVVLDRLRAMPGYDQYTKMQDQLRSGPPFVSGALTVSWDQDSSGFTYAFGGKMHRFDLATRKPTVTGDAPAAGAGRGGRGAAGGGGGGRGGRGGAARVMPNGAPNPCPVEQVDRGRQRACDPAPDGSMKAFYRDRNLWISRADGTEEIAVTKDGNEKARTKYGSGSWVYGEELGQTTAIWWSPDGTKVAFYRFDESPVQDFYLQLGQSQVQSALDVEAYPKAGTSNPIADVLVYDLKSRETKTFDVRDGQPFTNDVVGHYVYNISWAPDGRELFMHRTNRRQQIMEFVACSPETTKCRAIVREEWKTGWTDNRPAIRWLADNKRFIWESDRNGWTNYYLFDISGKLLHPLTSHTTFESGAIVKLDEAAKVLFYMARDGDNHMKMQLHRVGLDGKGDMRLTDPAFNHSVTVSPDNKYFTDVYQSHNQPPATRLVDAATGKIVEELATSDLTRFDQLGLRKVEQFTYKAADGQTTLYGTIAFPSNFDPSKKYPALVPVYGGPASGSNVPTESFATPNPNTEYGFLIVNLGSRAAPGMGRRVLDSIYMKLGITEMADMAEGIKALWSRPYFDKTRVGIYGTSYGGYTSALSLLKFPDVYTAAAASSAVTSWYHYDTIYTERYMWIPQENKEGYEGGNAMNFAKNLQGRLLIYYGTADNNVHPNNAMQLIRALQQAGKSFEVQVGPDAGHSSVNAQRMMEFFIENLVVRPDRLLVAGG
jgi:dipeptidyl-peptidase-4